jgi:hypothetical protein
MMRNNNFPQVFPTLWPECEQQRPEWSLFLRCAAWPLVCVGGWEASRLRKSHRPQSPWHGALGGAISTPSSSFLGSSIRLTVSPGMWNVAGKPKQRFGSLQMPGSEALQWLHCLLAWEFKPAASSSLPARAFASDVEEWPHRPCTMIKVLICPSVCLCTYYMWGYYISFSYIYYIYKIHI